MWLRALRVITDRTNPKMDWIGPKNGFAGWSTRGLILAGNGTMPGLLGRKNSYFNFVIEENDR